MKNIEKEELNLIELQQIEEYQVFKAEEYTVKENTSFNFEEIKVNEIKQVSTFEDDSKNKSKKTTNLNNDSNFKRLRNIISNTTTSVTTTISSTVIIGAVGATVVLTPIIEPDLFDKQEEVIEIYNYDISFDTGNICKAPEMISDVFSLPVELPILEAEGYQFDGWYYDSNYENYAVGGSEITQNTTLYAKWIKLYTITYDNSGLGDTLEIVENVSVMPEELPVLEAVGYRFDGWYLDKEFTEKPEPAMKLLSDITLYAKWTNYGEITITNYIVDTNADLTKKITITADFGLIDGYSAKIANTNTNEEFDISANNLDVINDNLVNDKYTYEIRIYDSNNKLAQATKYVIDTSNVEYIKNLDLEYLVTYNYPESDEEDVSINIYYSPYFDSQYSNVTTELELYDSENNLIESKVIDNNDIYSITDIEYNTYSIKSKSYVMIDGNKYFINHNNCENINNKQLDFETTPYYDKYMISLPYKTDDMVIVTLTYSHEVSGVMQTETDDNYIEVDEANSDEFIVYCGDTVESVDIAVSGFFDANEPSNRITNYVGDRYAYFESTKTATQQIINSIEHANTYVFDGSIQFDFNGYVDDSYKISMNVYDSNEYSLGSATPLGAYEYSYNASDYSYRILKINPTINFSDYSIFDDDTLEYTFEFMIYDNENNPVLENSIVRTNYVKPTGDVSLIDSSSPNCGDVVVTYNDDKTFNAYFHINTTVYEGATEDYKILIEFKDVDTGNIYKYIGTDKVAVIENVPSGIYGVTYYQVVLGEDNTYYVLQQTAVSGAVTLEYDSQYDDMLSQMNTTTNFTQNTDDIATEIDESKTYEIEFYNTAIEPNTDMQVYATLYKDDGAGGFIESNVSFVIPYDDLIIEGDTVTAIIDLTEYDYDSAEFDVRFSYQRITTYTDEIDSLIGADGYKGNKYIMIRYTFY